MRRQWLIDIRRNQDKTQLEISAAAGMSQAGYSDIERGAKDPSVATAKRIAAVLGFEWIRFFEEPAPAEDSA